MSQGLRISRLTGRDITPQLWDRFYEFYLCTIEKKWGQAYLTRDFFRMIGQRMPDQVRAIWQSAGSGCASFAGTVQCRRRRICWCVLPVWRRAQGLGEGGPLTQHGRQCGAGQCCCLHRAGTPAVGLHVAAAAQRFGRVRCCWQRI